MHYAIHDMLDEAAIAFETEGISEKEMRDAIVNALHGLALNRLGTGRELPWLLDVNVSTEEIKDDLGVFNQWETPNVAEGSAEWDAKRPMQNA